MPTMGPEKEVILWDRGERSESNAIISASGEWKGRALGPDRMASCPCTGAWDTYVTSWALS